MTKSSIPLPVIPSNTDFLQDVVELYRFLLACQEEFPGKDRFQIVSFSQEISAVDPLAILQEVAAPNRLHFYWENRTKEEAIVGYGTSKFITIRTAERFIKAQQFIEDCLKQTIRTGDTHLSGAGPHFFCSFTFFPASGNGNSSFPAATLFLPLFQVVKKKDTCILVVNLKIDKTANIQAVVNKVSNYLKKIDWSKYHQYERKNKIYPFAQIEKKNQRETAQEFKSAVASALSSIQQKELKKIVLAHALDIISPVPFQLIQSLENLRQYHPDCYIFSIGNGKGQNFIGASPERLISIQNQQLMTDALAGSAPRGKTVSEDTNIARQLSNSDKERREHQAVIEFIIQRLSQLGLKPRQSPRQLLQLSNIQHLWTPIYAQLPADLHPLEILAQLHPTPAVAGVPTEIACEQIRRYETFDRALYAAPIGWVDDRGNSQFVVGIRSALIKGDRARLYAGAGIVAGSDPDKEFAEVQLKLQSLLKALA